MGNINYSWFLPAGNDWFIDYREAYSAYNGMATLCAEWTLSAYVLTLFMFCVV